MKCVEGFRGICFLTLALHVSTTFTHSLTSHEAHLLHHVSKRTVNQFCSEVVCKSPPFGVQCKEVEKGDTSLPRPGGKQLDCCPLLKCRDPDGSSMFVFHGYFGRGPSVKDSNNGVGNNQNNENNSGGYCGGVSCKQPPTDATCSPLLNDDYSLKRPKGPKADCCPLLKCYEKDGLLFPFHGHFGRGPSQVAPTTKPPPKKFIEDNNENSACARFSCIPLPFDATCDKVSPFDTSVERPKGEKASCCPLYNCHNSDGSHFPFHGAFGKGPVTYPPREQNVFQNQKRPQENRPPSSDNNKVSFASFIDPDACAGTYCKQPPFDASCTRVKEIDPSMSPPKGAKANCCPLHKCFEKDGSVFPFHGFYGKGPVVQAATKPSVCESTECKLPPKSSTCSVVSQSDHTMERPSGRLADCCLLYRCTESDGSSYPFHGVYGAGPKSAFSKPFFAVTPPPEAKKPVVIESPTVPPVSAHPRDDEKVKQKPPGNEVTATTETPRKTNVETRPPTQPSSMANDIFHAKSFKLPPTKPPIDNDISFQMNFGSFAKPRTATTRKPVMPEPLSITTLKSKGSEIDYMDRFMHMPSMTFENNAGKVISVNKSSNVASVNPDVSSSSPAKPVNTDTKDPSSVTEVKYFDPKGGNIELEKTAKGKANATAMVFIGDPDGPPVDAKEQQKEFDNMEAEMAAMMKGTFGPK